MDTKGKEVIEWAKTNLNWLVFTERWIVNKHYCVREPIIRSRLSCKASLCSCGNSDGFPN